MCIIAIKKEGVEMPSDSIIRKMFNVNSHGAGFMIKRKRSKFVKVSKGHMTLEDFKSAISKEKIKTSDIVVMHFRIATIGGKSQRLTHPFIADMNPDVAEILEAKTDQLCIVHNGTIQEYRGVDSDRSDSSLFASLIMSSKVIGDNLSDGVIQELITDKLSGTRMAVINPKSHNVHIFGVWATSSSDYKWNESESGMIYSNYSWIPYKAKSHSGYGGDYFGDGDDYTKIGVGFKKEDKYDWEKEGEDCQLTIDDFSENEFSDSKLILDDFNSLGLDYRESYLKFMECSSNEFERSVELGMRMVTYVDSIVDWMNDLGISDMEPQNKSLSTGLQIKTKDGWESIKTDLEKK